MEGLGEQELQTLVGFAHDAARIARYEPRRLERWTVERVGDLIPADTVHVQVGKWPPAEAGTFSYLIGDEPRFAEFRNSPEGRAEWARLIDEHPLAIERMRSPRETRAIRLSDFVTLRQLHALEVYDIVLRPFDLNHCVTARFFGPSRVYDLSCARSSVDFVRRDLLLVDVAATVLGMAVRLPPPLVPPHLEGLGITEREAQVLDCVARGRSNAEIAGELSVAPGTVKKHLDNIFEKLGVRNRVGAARIWIGASSSQVADDLGLSRSTANDQVA
jgi:DNA-binding CsgD family transcriptional regulator